jgi:hypothetical protein
MSESEPIQSEPIPTYMKWRFKQLKKHLKETVTMTPNNGQSTVRPGQRIIVDLPLIQLLIYQHSHGFTKVRQNMLVQPLIVLLDIFVLDFFHVILLLLFNLCK